MIRAAHLLAGSVATTVRARPNEGLPAANKRRRLTGRRALLQRPSQLKLPLADQNRTACIVGKIAFFVDGIDRALRAYLRGEQPTMRLKAVLNEFSDS